MTYPKSIWALIGAVALAGAIAPTHADEAAGDLSATAVECDGLSRDDARQLAQEAQRDGAHRRAAECFRIAGDLVQTDRALIRAHADESAVSGRKAATTIDAAKRQAQLVRAAFRKPEPSRR